MGTGYSKFIPTLSFIGEVILLNGLFTFGFAMYNPALAYHAESILLYLYLNGIWVLISVGSRSFEMKRYTLLWPLLSRTVNQVILFFFLFLMYFQAVTVDYYSRDHVKWIFGIFVVLLFLWKFLLYFGFLYYRSLGYNFRRVLFVGMNAPASQIYSSFRVNTWMGNRILGYVGEKGTGGKTYLGPLEAIATIMEKYRPDEVYIAYTLLSAKEQTQMSEILYRFPVQVHLIPDIGAFTYQQVEWRDVGSTSVMSLHTGPLAHLSNRIVKRTVDIVISLFIILLILSWMIPVLFLINLFSGGGGIWFIQERTSLYGRTFRIIKFRSMMHNEEAHVQQAVENDRRITALGAFLRRTNIDELPQFFNVLMGHMSVIGPRPHMLAHTEAYKSLVARYMIRHTVKPGISGLAQVTGYRGEIRSVEDIRRRVEKDIEYIKRWSAGLDALIFWQSIVLVCRESLRWMGHRKTGV